MREEKVTDDMVETALNRGINNMVSSIADMDIKTNVKREKPQVEKYTHYEGTDLAELALDVYKTKVKPEEPQKVPEYKATNPPPTRAKAANMSAIARSLAGMRNGGDAGKNAPPAGPNGGNTGNPGPSNYYALTTSMSMEEYEEHIHKKFGIVEEEELEPLKEPEQELLVEGSPVSDLEEELLKLEDTSWQSIDKVMRGIAKEYDITPKELHKEFKATHNGLIPDEWIKKQEVTEECGWFPLNEAQLHRQGHVYDVSMIWKGNTTRSKFFWPESRMPSRDEMQNATNGFYPGSRLMAYYPSEDEGDFMVLVPPMTENYEFVPFDQWVQLNDKDTETYQTIMEEVGEPVTTPELLLEGYYEVVVEDHDTGEQQVVHFGEGKKGLWDNIHAKRKRGEKPAKKGSKDYPETLNVEEVIVEDDMKGMSQKSGDKRSTESGAGLTSKGVAKYRAKNPGSKLKTAVTTPPSKLKAGSKAAGRRKSFCARSRSWDGERGKAARKRWNC